MILRELLYKGPRRITPRTAEVPTVPAGCYQNFYQTFYQKWTTFDKNYQKDNLWGSFYWFILLIKLINY